MVKAFEFMAIRQIVMAREAIHGNSSGIHGESPQIHGNPENSHISHQN
ncbi:MAG TPA: hypothetical protein K8V56_06820 [Sporosarcina psychrophila]|uniref:Uncharacterized protein n=1 Tax=Sporosarcina psychrophila TaxID=1476 RepID=A0A921FYP1_SPOPS|nr:hypothetical protein [Sporosarcina psychrophila]